jgi:hypothetical protein
LPRLSGPTARGIRRACAAGCPRANSPAA